MYHRSVGTHMINISVLHGQIWSPGQTVASLGCGRDGAARHCIRRRSFTYRPRLVGRGPRAAARVAEPRMPALINGRRDGASAEGGWPDSRRTAMGGGVRVRVVPTTSRYLLGPSPPFS